MNKEARYFTLQELITSINDPILDSLLYSPEFQEFLISQGPGLSALIRQSVLDLFRIHSQENGAARQQSFPCNCVPEVRVAASHSTVQLSSAHQSMQALRAGTAPMSGKATAFRNKVEPPGRTGASLLSAAQPPLEPSPEPALASNSPEFIKQTIIDLIEEATGYPRDMIGTDKSLERDLRIDSIKRNEMLLVLQKKLGLQPINDDSFWQDESVDSLTRKLLALSGR